MYKINRHASYCPITWTTLSPATTLPLLAADSFISSVPSSVPTFWRTAFWCSLAPTKWYSFSSLPTMHYRHNKYGFSTRFLRHLHVACAFYFLLLYPPPATFVNCALNLHPFSDAFCLRIASSESHGKICKSIIVMI